MRFPGRTTLVKARRALADNPKLVLFALVFFLWGHLSASYISPPHLQQQPFDNDNNNIPSVVEEDGVNAEYSEEAAAAAAVPVDGSTLSRRIPVHVRLHRILSPVQNSKLQCDKSREDILDALVTAKDVWASQAGIELDFEVLDFAATERMDREYEAHLVKFTNPKVWYGPAAVVEDISRIVQYEKLDAWRRENTVSIFCLGAFVGNNAVTMDKLIYIRTLQFLPNDLPMDNLRFGRIVAHELGHSFDLRHPTQRFFCHNSCARGGCSLMCQQRSIPKTHDPRLAVTLMGGEIRHSRFRAAYFYDTKSTPTSPGKHIAGLHPFEQAMSSAQAAGTKLFLFPDAMQGTVMASKIRFQFTKIRPMDVALVAVDATGKQMRVLAWNSFGPVRSGRNEDDATAELDFSAVDFTWWMARRHIEAEIRPPVQVNKGERWGLLFSVPVVTMVTVPGSAVWGIKSNSFRAKQLPEFSEMVRDAIVALPDGLDSPQRGLMPKMNLEVM